MSEVLNTTMLRTALGFYGEREIPGAPSNPVINTMLKSVGLPPRDSIAWCSAFVNYVAKICGAERTGSGMARSWLSMGECVYRVYSMETVGFITNATPGDVAVFQRGSTPYQGHVGFLVRIDYGKKLVYCIGGNQSNEVCIKPYPMRKLISVRRLRYLNHLALDRKTRT